MDKTTWGGKCPTWEQFINESRINETSTGKSFLASKIASNEYDANSLKAMRPRLNDALYGGNVVYEDDEISIVGVVQDKSEIYTLLYKINDMKTNSCFFIAFDTLDKENVDEVNIRVTDAKTNAEAKIMPMCLLNNREALKALTDDISQTIGMEISWKDLSKAVKDGHYKIDTSANNYKGDFLFV